MNEIKEKRKLFSITKKDFEISYFSGHGAGGQHRNKHKNCVRIKHIATGIIKTGQAQRNLEQNKRAAFLSLTSDEKFKLWLGKKASEAMMDIEGIEKKVETMMETKNIKIEKFNAKLNKWEQFPEVPE